VLIERVPAISAPELGLRRGRIRVHLNDGSDDVREVTLGEGATSWALWAHEMRFALDNTSFIDLGDAVYRCATINRVEPEEVAASATDEALQACLGALTAIRDKGIGDPRGLAAIMLQTLEERGFVLQVEGV
jgi:hypothetical protein